MGDMRGGTASEIKQGVPGALALWGERSGEEMANYRKSYTGGNYRKSYPGGNYRKKSQGGNYRKMTTIKSGARKKTSPK